jgi:hypothetical protein
MRSQRFGQAKVDVGKPQGQLLTKTRQVAPHVDACRQEVRQQDHALCTLLHAPRSRLWDRRLCQLQKRGLDEVITAALAQVHREVVQVDIGLLLPAAVGYE